MTILGKWKKQPGETIDYDVDYTEFFAERADDIVSVTFAVPAGIVQAGDSRTGKVAKVWISGGTSGVIYKVTVVMVTTSVPAVIKEDEFTIAVREI